MDLGRFSLFGTKVGYRRGWLACEPKPGKGEGTMISIVFKLLALMGEWQWLFGEWQWKFGEWQWF
jgi:hypothetical protein